jgi:hypothetical protein
VVRPGWSKRENVQRNSRRANARLWAGACPACRTSDERVLLCSSSLPPPSPPAEKATARQNHSGQASTGDGAGDGRAPRAPVRADGTPSDPNHPVERRPAHREGTIIATLHLIDRRDETILSTKV